MSRTLYKSQQVIKPGRSLGSESSENDLQLMQRIGEGDETAFRTLVERYYTLVFRLCMRYVGSGEDAEELAQDVFIRIHRNAHRYRPKGKLTTYIYRIAVNLSLNRIRDQKRKRWISLDFLRESKGMEPDAPFRDNPEFQMELSETQQIVQGAIRLLPDNQRTAVILKRFKGLSYQEIADVMDCSVPAVESLLHRAKLSLTKKLKNLQ